MSQGPVDQPAPALTVRAGHDSFEATLDVTPQGGRSRGLSRDSIFVLLRQTGWMLLATVAFAVTGMLPLAAVTVLFWIGYVIAGLLGFVQMFDDEHRALDFGDGRVIAETLVVSCDRDQLQIEHRRDGALVKASVLPLEQIATGDRVGPTVLRGRGGARLTFGGRAGLSLRRRDGTLVSFDGLNLLGREEAVEWLHEALIGPVSDARARLEEQQIPEELERLRRLRKSKREG